MRPIIDPRRGDIEDDASSTKRKSLFSLAGSLLAEISLPKLAWAWTMLIVIPSLALGVAPIAFAIWFGKVSDRISSSLAGVWSAIVFLILLAIGWFGGRTLFRFVESSFWSLNSLAVQPIYTACRETLRHLAERFLSPQATDARRSKLRAASAIVSGLVICGISVGVLLVAWPHAYLMSEIAAIISPKQLAIAAIANSATLVAAYLAIAALVWALADATMAQPRDLIKFDAHPAEGRTWRIAHLSDIHVVGERYGFRIESGRSGPSGNERLRQVLARLEAIHTTDPLHIILITGDLTDAGRSVEWAEFFDAITPYPNLRALMLMIPGNHDLNIVDRSNPARFDLPTSPNKRLRKLRFLSAMGALQGERAYIVDRQHRRYDESLAMQLTAHIDLMGKFAEAGRPRFSTELVRLWASVFPMIVPPERDDGLGIVLLDSNADAHFSFTNALGMISAEQARGIDVAVAQYPDAYWVVALHHHLVEYPRAAKALSERIGTALINGNWFARRLRRLAGRAVVMHGHRHIDWIGECSGVPIISAPSPVMEASDDMTTCFHIHTLAVGSDGRLGLLQPETIAVHGQSRPDEDTQP